MSALDYALREEHGGVIEAILSHAHATGAHALDALWQRDNRRGEPVPHNSSLLHCYCWADAHKQEGVLKILREHPHVRSLLQWRGIGAQDQTLRFNPETGSVFAEPNRPKEPRPPPAAAIEPAPAVDWSDWMPTVYQPPAAAAASSSEAPTPNWQLPPEWLAAGAGSAADFGVDAGAMATLDKWARETFAAHTPELPAASTGAPDFDSAAYTSMGFSQGAFGPPVQCGRRGNKGKGKARASC